MIFLPMNWRSCRGDNVVTVLGDRILKVNHAGEHGAVHIYAGQCFFGRFTAPDIVANLIICQEHEAKHRAIFAQEMVRRKLRRCRSYWFCALGGFALGLITGGLGQQAIAATTFAVEHVVLKHLKEQIHLLSGCDDTAVQVIQCIFMEEQSHYDLAAQQIKQPNVLLQLLIFMVKMATEAVIWFGMRL